MHLTLILTLAGLAPAVPLREPEDNDPTMVVLRLKCPSPADAAVCKKLFLDPAVSASAVHAYWVAALPVVKEHKDAGAWLNRHLHVRVSGGETIRVWVGGGVPRRDRAGLANAVLAAWWTRFWSANLRQQFADMAAERHAAERMGHREQAAHRKHNQARLDYVAASRTANEKKAREELEAAGREEQAATDAYQPVAAAFAKALGRGCYVVVRLADGPRNPELEEDTRLSQAAERPARTERARR
jgi:hypothetical protein